MNSRVILMSAHQVHAALAGTMTQMRTVLKHQPVFGAAGDLWYPHPPTARSMHYATERHWRAGAVADWSPWGAPGDRLWVRETFEYVHPCQVAEGRYSQPCTAGIPGPPPVDYRTIYRADGPYPGVARVADHPYYVADPDTKDELYRGDTWTPSIHMPRRDSRIDLEIVSVRVERLQDITEEDARAEGLPRNWAGDLPGWTAEDAGWLTPAGWRNAERGRDCDDAGLVGGAPAFVFAAREAFALWWDHVNGKRAPWLSNPWVWRIEVKPC